MKTVIEELYRRLKLRQQLLDWFEPLEYQKEAYLSDAPTQLFEGPNRCGKTEIAIIKVIQIALGTHPTIKREPPQRIRIVSTSLEQGAEGVILDKLRQFCPANQMFSGTFDGAYRKEPRMLTFKNGSTIQLMAGTQPVHSMRGTALDVFLADEEPPEDVWDENITRLSDRAGIALLSMTPHAGLTWSYKRLYKQADKLPGIKKYHFDTMKNYFINRREMIMKHLNMSQRELDIRLFGKRVAFSGLVYHVFDESTHLVSPFNLPDNSILFLGVDFGLSNPTAGSLRALVPNEKDITKDCSYIIDEYYEVGKTIGENARKMAEWINLKWGKYLLKFIRIDPNSGDKRSEQTGERNSDIFRREFQKAYGKPIAVSGGERGNNVVEHRIGVVLEELTPRDGFIKLRFFSNCTYHIDELLEYSYIHRSSEDLNRFEKPRQFKDHLMNAMEYVAEANPRRFNPMKRLAEGLRNPYKIG